MPASTAAETVDHLLELITHPYIKVSLEIAQAAKTFIQGSPVQNAVRMVAKSNLESVEEAMEELRWKKNTQSAAEGILTLLESSYRIFKNYYETMPKQMKVQIPGLWEFNEFHRSVLGAAEIEDTIARICFLKAVYHKAVEDNPYLVRKWLCEKEFPCDNYKILVGLLGQDIAIEYVASNPEFGSRMVGRYLAEKGVSLADYQSQQTSSVGFDGISFGEEDPIIYLD